LGACQQTTGFQVDHVLILQEHNNENNKHLVVKKLPIDGIFLEEEH